MKLLSLTWLTLLFISTDKVAINNTAMLLHYGQIKGISNLMIANPHNKHINLSANMMHSS